MDWALAIVALTLLGVGAVSGRLSGTPVTPAILFVVVGLLVGPEVLGEIDLESSSGTVRALAEATWRWCCSATPRASISGSFGVRSVCRCACSASACR